MSTKAPGYQRARIILLLLALAVISYIAAFGFSFDRFATFLQPAPTVATYSVKIRQQEADLVRTELAAADLAQLQGQSDQAISWYRKALILTPTAQIYAQLVTILVAQDSIPQATTVLAEALRRFPTDANLLQLQADVQFAQ